MTSWTKCCDTRHLPLQRALEMAEELEVDASKCKSLDAIFVRIYQEYCRPRTFSGEAEMKKTARPLVVSVVIGDDDHWSR